MKKIRVLVIENNQFALDNMKEVFANQNKFKFESFVEGSDSREVAIKRDEHIKLIEQRIEQFDYDVLIIDLLLRDTYLIEKEQFDENLSGADKLVSIQVAKKFEKQLSENQVLLVFTSSFHLCKKHYQFEKLRKENPGVVPKKSIFIFKPVQGDEDIYMENCPVKSEGTFCRKDRESKKGCRKNICFLHVLEKYYIDFCEEVGK